MGACECVSCECDLRYVFGDCVYLRGKLRGRSGVGFLDRVEEWKE